MTKSFFIVFLLFFLNIFSQSIYSKNIESQFRDYNQLIKDKQFEKALDLYAMDEFFEIVPKRTMVEMMKQVFESQEIKYKIYLPEKIFVDDDILKIDNKNYVKIRYDQNLEMLFNVEGLTNDDLLQALKIEFGKDNVKLNKDTGFFEVFTEKNAVAYSKDLINWKFTIIEKKQIPVLKKFIPEKLLEN